ncbi:UNVERIFIED_CONTAM: ATP synthase subunit d, mitochondrial [Sesamum calycinum]|uniref:ATP synthase subunit d, mitochondrial n=1 Tax=Sesamum calycinum TaxID=2727403 RepID=A0AAW2SEC6_9LAMI
MAKLLVSDEARKEFATLRRAFDEVNTQLQTKFSQEGVALCRLVQNRAESLLCSDCKIRFETYWRHHLGRASLCLTPSGGLGFLA